MKQIKNLNNESEYNNKLYELWYSGNNNDFVNYLLEIGVFEPVMWGKSRNENANNKLYYIYQNQLNLIQKFILFYNRKNKIKSINSNKIYLEINNNDIKLNLIF